MDSTTKLKIKKLEDERDSRVERIRWHNEKLDKQRIAINQIDSELDKLYEQYKRDLRASSGSGNKSKG